MCYASIVEGRGYHAKVYHGYNLSYKTSYNLNSTDLIVTDFLYAGLVWWSEPHKFPIAWLLCIFGWNGCVLFHQVT